MSSIKPIMRHCLGIHRYSLLATFTKTLMASLEGVFKYEANPHSLAKWPMYYYLLGHIYTWLLKVHEHYKHIILLLKKV
jgi:hypothetical protein